MLNIHSLRVRKREKRLKRVKQRIDPLAHVIWLIFYALKFLLHLFRLVFKRCVDDIVLMKNGDKGKLVTNSCDKMSPNTRLNELPSPVSGSDVPSINFLQLEDSDSDASPEDDGYELLNANELDNYEENESLNSDHVNLSHPHGSCTFEPHTHRELSNMEVEEEEKGPSSSSGRKHSTHQLTPGKNSKCHGIINHLLPQINRRL